MKIKHIGCQFVEGCILALIVENPELCDSIEWRAQCPEYRRFIYNYDWWRLGKKGLQAMGVTK